MECGCTRCGASRAPATAPDNGRLQAAITGYITDLTQLIDQINGIPASHEEDIR